MADIEILTVDQVAERVQLSVKTVMRAIRAGDLEASQLTRGRGGWRVRETAIASWLEARSNRRRPRPLAAVRAIEPVPGPRRPSRGATSAPVSGRLTV